ncbi:MAG: sensor histidine kinase N-terminal domain-containing protein [Betaproteobacteria bacterium]|jgi:two-component system sensor histidine kinase TctE|nr:sensor histidine kinase N-terminal domain-containing protein [Betaproteobacteria bacterium]
MLADAPLRRQLLIWLVPPILLLWSASAWITYSVAYRFATSAFDRALHDSAIALAGQLRVDTTGRVMVDLPQTAQKVLVSDLRDRVYYSVSGPGGEFLMGYSGMPVPPVRNALLRRAVGPPDPVEDTDAGSGLDIELPPPRFYQAEYRGQPVRIAAMSVPLVSLSAGRIEGYALVQVGETLVERREMARDVLIATLLPQIALMLLMLGMVYVGIGRSVAPVEALRREIENRSIRDLTPVKEDRAPPEVRRLVRSLNDLLARMSTTLAAQQRFIADAAHQLRTPTAALKTQVELAQRAGDPAETRERLAQIHAAADRNARLVNQLLSLARAEPGRTEPMAHRPVDIVDIARAAAEHWVPQAIARSIDLGFEAGCRRTEGPVTVSGDAVMLTEMLGNLIDNALRYTQPGGTVTVSVERAVEAGRAKVRLGVEDNGPGIEEAERERVFERFHRVLGTGTEGAGLGLAIVREIARAHGGRVDLATGSGGAGARFTVVLPVSETAAAAGPAAAPAAPAPGPAAAARPGSLPG